MQPLALLPLPTYPEACSDDTAAAAIAMAKELGISVHALAINVEIPNVSNALSKVLLKLPELIREAEVASRKRGRALLKSVATAAEGADVILSTDEIAVPPAESGDTAAVHARYHDLSLIAWESGNETGQMVAEAVIFGSGRPALLVPRGWDASPLDHVAIAWDGSRVAARAVADAQFLLGCAAKISILTVLDDKPLHDEATGERLAARLVKRGMPAKALTIRAEDCPIAVTLQEHALEAGAGVLTMGGYGHSRMRDFVLGGATQGVLTDLRLPLLLSH